MAEHQSRIVPGLGVFFVIGVLAEIGSTESSATFSLFSQEFSLAFVDGLLMTFLTCLVASLVARRGLLVPVLILVSGIWAALIYILHQIALPAGPSSLADIAVSNFPGLLATLGAAATGVVVGEQYYKREFEARAPAS